MLVGVVGPCGSGKSTLVENLKKRSIDARHIAQEHSYVKDMWQRLTKPDILVFLNASYPVATRRRNLNWTIDEYEEQLNRLSHARVNANFVIDTDKLTPDEIVEQVMQFLGNSLKTDLVK